MRPSPDAAAVVGAFLARAARRQRLLAAVRGAARGVGVASLTLAAPMTPAQALVVAAVAAAIGGSIGWASGWRSRDRVAALVERRAPRCRNLLVTAAELLERPDWMVAPHVRTRVLADAAALVPDLDVRVTLPARATATAAAIAAMLWTGAAALALPRGASPSATPAPSSPTAARIAGVQIVVTPPAYANRSTQTLTDPSRVTALAGSQVHIVVQADAAAVSLETVAGTQPLAPSGAHAFAGELLADADGFLAMTPAATDGSTGVKRLIGLVVTPDLPPNVRLTTPGHDLLVDNGKRTVALVAEADDDLGLASLRLRYTKVAGSGENFTFTDGEVPLEIARAADGRWTGRAAWKLDALALEPGDMVIYRATATDKRPGAPPAESDTFIVEIAAPGALPSEGFAIDDRQDKYAISQQMVIVKTERALSRRSAMTAEDFKDEILGIAAEQRQVRAEFVFMMGGELADAGLDASVLNEEAEAAGEEDLAAGRMANQGRADLIRAIRAMSRAAARLGDADAVAALPIEKQALTYLQRAFSRSRYILRTLSERERLDLSRRLTGTLAALSRPARPAAEAMPNPRVTALRRALADLAALAAQINDAGAAAEAARVAQRVLQVDPASDALRDIAAAITTLELDRASVALAAVVRAALPDNGAGRRDPDLNQIEGAVADALRKAGKER